LQKALRLNPASVELQYELGLAQGSAGEFDAARITLNTVARLRPEWLKVLFARDLALPSIYLSDQHIADSRESWAIGIASIEARLLMDSPESIKECVEAVSGYAPFYLHYQGLDNTDLQRRFGGIVSKVAAQAWPQFAEPVAWKLHTHGGRLRVGFVSAYLRQHSVGHFFSNWICQLESEKFESFVWYTGEAADAMTEKIRARATHFFHTAFDISSLAKAIHASQVDILIYLDVGMHPASQVLAALRLAPIQCVTFGHPVTTGIDSIDYFLSADAAEPPNAAPHYAEKLIRLPRFAISYARPDVSRQRTPSALTSSQRPLILCAQPLFKILPHFDRLAARIARALPGCRLVFIESLWPRVNAAFVARISAALQKAGVDPSRTLQMLPIMPYEEYLGTLNAADVILDTPGFSGGNSSFDAIAVGAPVVSHRGQMLRARQTAAMLDIVGLGEFASEADDDFVRNAISIASNNDRQREIRERMKTGSGALFDDCETVRVLETQLVKLAKNF
jgi:predicted O-linked N-acetylglucosamine transferase (SPINDLY family)